MGQQVGVTAGREQRYYTALGLGADALVRCKDCQALVTKDTIQTYGSCTCGNRRFAEIITLTEAEHAHVQTLDFPYKDQFLAEFRARG